MKFAPLLAPLSVCALAACGVDDDDLLQEWRDEAADHGDVGVAGSFSFAAADDGSAFDIAGDVVADPVSAPVTVSGGAVVVEGFVNDGVTGRLSFPSGARFDEGVVEGVVGVGVSSDGLLRDGGGAVVVRGGVVTSGSASFAPDDGSAAVDLAPTPEAPLFVDGALGGSAGLYVVADAGFSAHVDDLALGGSAVGAVVAGADEFAGASAVFARDVDLACAGGQCDGAGRVTQVVVDGEPRLAADVEIAAYDPALDRRLFGDGLVVELEPGEVRSLFFAFREKSFVGDGVVAGVAAKGAAKDMIRLGAAPPDLPATTIIGRMQQDGVIDAGETLVLVVAGPAIVIADALVTIGDALGGFFGGGGAEPEPVPIPSWVQAGAVGTFSIVVAVPTGADDGDEFDARVVVKGANFDDAAVAFTVVVDD